MKKVIVFGGGTGLSCLLSGLKLFPLDVTTVITVSDNGSSTGVLKRELDIPAVGDIGKVLIAMANVDEDFTKLLGYRFSRDGSLYNHPVRNIMLAALIDLKGNLSEAVNCMSRMLNIRGTILPLTEEKVELVGINGSEEYYGQVAVSANAQNIRRLDYDHRIHVSDAVIEKIGEADLIIFSPGSLYTSILPHLLSPEMLKAFAAARAPILYVSNIVTQPGETDHYSVSEHVGVLNSYLKDRKVDIVLSNNSMPDPEIAEHYLKTEGKEPVLLDREAIRSMDAELIEDDLLSVDDGAIRHNALKTAFQIFAWLMRNE
ncbi:MAG: uridine diphosphate-N-acetylglucosamine-binding protein YvcK [Oscillospiraceae bacterium]|nr:uridine diphosphate-N-acetylglucosamine-binding protein YvcK [Oscillospiraceae bacterium]